MSAPLALGDEGAEVSVLHGALGGEDLAVGDDVDSGCEQARGEPSDGKMTNSRPRGVVPHGDRCIQRGTGVYLQRRLEEFVIQTTFRIRLFLAALLCCFLTVCARAEPIPVRHVEGTSRGYLSARDSDGRIVAMGDFYQIAHGDRVTLHLVFHFKDGSIDDDTTVYTQHGSFRVLSEHHIQRGPFFPRPLETTIDVRSGQVTVRTTGKDGKEEVTTEHMQLPADLANGLGFISAKNIAPGGSATVSMLIAMPKPRLVKLTYTAAGEDSFSVAGVERKAIRIDMKIDLGGIAGVIAPLIGRQPPDFNIWIAGGEAPAFVKEVGYLFRDGPILTFELTSPVWAKSSDAKIVSLK